jgi:ABC-2 type transport system permease protein
MTATSAPLSVRPFGAIGAYLRLELQRMSRNRRYLVFAVGFPVVFYLLYTGLLQGDGATTNRDPGWPAFFMVSMAAYGMMGAAMTSGIAIAQERASGWTRQLRVTPLPPSGYVTTKLLVAYVTSLPALVLVLAAAVIVNHVSLAATTWLDIVVSLAIGVLPFAAFGILIGYLFDTNTAQPVVMVSYLGLAIIGGLWAPISTFPDTVATIARVTPTYHFADLGWTALAGRTPDPVDIAVVAAYGVFFLGLVAWRYRVGEQRARG